MAIAVVMEFAAGTLEQYDDLCNTMGLRPGGSAPPGCLFHWVTATDTGLRVTDVWQSRELYEEFAHNQIGPHSAEVALPVPPATTYLVVHNYLTGT